MRPLKKIVNPSEAVALESLQVLAADYGYRVHPKVRLADVAPIEGSGIRDDLFSFALKSHFDFVACNESHDPVFAVEFDGPSHRGKEQRERDSKKDEICQIFEIPILRINSNHLIKKYNRESLLKWIISAWELLKSFNEAQEKGQVPEDEDFYVLAFHHPGKTIEEAHPHWLSLKPLLTIQKLHKEGRIPMGHTCSVVFTDADENYRGIEWIDVDGEKVIAVETAMRRQHFPLYMGDLFCELLTVLLFDKLVDFLETKQGSVDPSEISIRLQDMKERYQMARSHSGGGTRVTFSYSNKDRLDRPSKGI
jgi:hypothetical protein